LKWVGETKKRAGISLFRAHVSLKWVGVSLFRAHVIKKRAHVSLFREGKTKKREHIRSKSIHFMKKEVAKTGKLRHATGDS
jgi:hypothetical protein